MPETAPPQLAIPKGVILPVLKSCGKGTTSYFSRSVPVPQVALEAAEKLSQEGYNASVVDARIVKPLDTAMLDALHGKPIVTVEENALAGGFGSAVLEYYEQSGQLQGLSLCRMGFDDVFYEHANRKEQLALCGLNADSLYQCAVQVLSASRNALAK